MSDTKEGLNNSEDKREMRLLNRNKTIALLARDTVIKRIKAISDVSTRIDASPDLIPSFLISVEELDSLWESFLVKNRAVLEALLDLDLASDFDTNLETEVRVYYNTAMTAADQHRPQRTTFSVNGLVNPRDRVGSIYSQCSNPMASTSGSRLPEIPLPVYDGDLTGWPVFRDRFRALVVNRVDLSNIERFYYLLGCLRGEALDTISSINVSDDTYELAWTTLSDRFDKPRQLATIIVDKLLSTTDQSTESIDGLKNFLSLYSDQVSLLRTLSVPDLGDFLLFSIATRRLSLTTRKGFEATNTQDFPTMTDLIKYVKNRVSLLEAVSITADSRRSIAVRVKANSNGSRFVEKRSKTSLVTSDTSNTTSIICLFCSESHKSINCPKLLSLPVEERYHLAKEKRICFRCLESTHWSNKCKISKSCQKCSGRHHTLLHKRVSTSTPTSSRNPEVSLLRAAEQLTILLGTALVHIRDKYGCMQNARVLIDSASQISVISSACAERLGLRRSKWTVPVSGLSGVQVPDVKGIVNCYITPRHDTKHCLQIQAWVLPNVTNNMPSCQLPTHFKERFSKLVLADPSFDKPAPIDLLLGADVFSQILDGEWLSLDKSLPTAFSSIFGWIVIGPVNNVSSDSKMSNLVSLTVSLEDMIHRFWSIEEPDVAPMSFTENGRCEEIYTSERERNTKGRFVVPLPFKSPADTLSFPGSRQVALRRFQNLERKLQSNEVLYENYRKFMYEYEALGHMSVATTPGSYFIPHHAVFKAVADSGKLRVVFDASAEALSKRSLNQCLFTGPKLQQDIVDILLRFRVHKVAFTADICKMYRQILVLPKHRNFQHIFWRPSPLDEVKKFELNTVTYGLSCAPFLALRVLQDIAEQECQNLPDVRDALNSQTYVDDICVGSDTTKDLIKLQSDLKKVLTRAGFELKKWTSNSQAILSSIPAEDRALGALEFDSDDGTIVKVLGLQWDSVRDMFSYNVNSSITVITKRSILSTIARIFDPLGLLAPTTFLAKHMMQQIWKAHISWDETLPTDWSDWWSSFVSDLPVLSELNVQRYLATHKQSTVQLCGFCDASERGYAAVVYLRVPLPDKTFSVSLLGCKTKMAPLKATTIPRLELCAAYLLARWMSRVQRALANRVFIDNIHTWSDSQIVLSWLVNPHTDFKVFVSNRVNQIKQMLPYCQWHYVRSSSNPADCASRGLMPSELLRHALYWSGPSVDFYGGDYETGNQACPITNGMTMYLYLFISPYLFIFIYL